MKKIWLYRWIFDPVHNWHQEIIEKSFNNLQIDKLKVIVKILWEKDPIASISQRIDMLRLQIQNNDRIDFIAHNISWHINEILDFSSKYWRKNIYQICGSDKFEREIDIYWKYWDNFWVWNRDNFIVDADILNNYQSKVNLTLLPLQYSDSSTNIKNQLLINRNIKPEWLNQKVYEYILENDLYILNKNSIYEFIKNWKFFINYLNSYFPEFKLYELNIPSFNKFQHKDWWKDKFIRYIVKENKISWDNLLRFFDIAYKFNW